MATETVEAANGSEAFTELSAFQRDILGVLAHHGPTHGLGLKDEIEALYGLGRVNHGRLYPNLNELDQKGYLEIGEIDKRTNSYQLSEKGEKAILMFSTWLEAGLENGDEA